jgi:hypothetical protein
MACSVDYKYFCSVITNDQQSDYKNNIVVSLPNDQ